MIEKNSLESDDLPIVQVNEASVGGESSAVRGGSTAEKSVLTSWFRDMVVSVVVSAFIILFLYQPVRVQKHHHIAAMDVPNAVRHLVDE